jgi:hypothetical protein
MKLIYCPVCGDVRSLRKIPVSCECGKSTGLLESGGIAVIEGPAIPLGFANRSFTMALLNRQPRGPGVQFKAFVISKECSTVVSNNRCCRITTDHRHHYCPECSTNQLFFANHCATCNWNLPVAKQ